MDRRVVHDWLRSVLGPYGDSQRTFADVVAALDALPSLSPRTDLYISNEGHSSLLLHVKGTLPIQFRGNTYNIPVQVWLPRAYPREAPIGYVVPTQNMLVRKTADVDLDGLIAGEYHTNWSRKWETKSLVAYLDACRDIFSKQPPVYAKPPAPTATAATPSSSQRPMAPPSSSSPAPSRASPSPGPQKPPPPLPGQAQEATGSHSSQPAGPPQRPPKAFGQQVPPVQDSYSYPHSPHLASSSSAPRPNHRPSESPRQPHGAFHPTPSLGPHPQHQQSHFYHQDRAPSRSASIDGVVANQHTGPQRQSGTFSAVHEHPHSPLHGQQRQYQHQQYQQHQRSDSVPRTYQQHQPYSPYPPADAASHSQPDPQRRPQSIQGHPTHYHSPTGQQGPPSLPQHQSSRAQNPAPTPAPNGTSSSLQAATLPLPAKDLLASLDDDENNGSVNALTDTSTVSRAQPGPQNGGSAAPPPPRPPNPELHSLHLALHAKITARISALRSQLSTSNSHLAVIASDLDRGPAAIQDETARLCAVRDVCRTRAEKVEAAVAQAKEITAGLRSREGKVDSREVVLADSIVGDQLIGLLSADLALTDVLYHLGRALGSESLDLDRYLKWVRMCGREQFLKRALAAKIQAGLSHEGGSDNNGRHGLTQGTTTTTTTTTTSAYGEGGIGARD